MNPASRDIKDMLDGESSLGLTFATDLFYGQEPAGVDNAVTIFDTPGGPPQLTTSPKGTGEDYSYPSVQVRVRNRDYDTGWNLINDIKEFLHGTANETVNNMLYTVIFCTSEPAMLDFDENERVRFVANFSLQRRNP